MDVSLLQAGDVVTGLSLGEAAFTPLKTYLRKHAKTHQDRSLARTYVVRSEGKGRKIIAYMTLICGEVVSENDGQPVELDEAAHYPYLQYPAIKIARLAVNTDLRGGGIGTKLVLLAIGIAKELICPSVGCRFVVVDAKRNSVSFYERECNFRLLDSPENRARDEPVMFFDLYNTD